MTATRRLVVVIAAAVTLLVVACSTEDQSSPPEPDALFTDSPALVRAQCLETARLLQFPVPCPRRLPSGSHPTVFAGGNCPGRDVWIGPGCGEAAANAFASIEFDDPTGVGHLVIVAMPGLVSAEAVIYAPLPPEQWGSLRPAGTAIVNGIEAQSFEVPEDSSTAFGGHLVVVWALGGQTYALGFHGTDDVAAQRNAAVLRDIEMVASES